jgi:inner membrane protein
MTWPTHGAIALNTLWLIYLITPNTVAVSVGLLAVCAVGGGLLPDLDASDSKLQHITLLTPSTRPMALLSRAIRQTSPHRGWLHSLLGLIMIGVLSTPIFVLIGLTAWLILLCGYATHLLADMLNPSGIPLFYPNHRRFHLLPHKWRITTGTDMEEAVFAIAACAVLPLLIQLLTTT